VIASSDPTQPPDEERTAYNSQPQNDQSRVALAREPVPHVQGTEHHEKEPHTDEVYTEAPDLSHNPVPLRGWFIPYFPHARERVESFELLFRQGAIVAGTSGPDSRNRRRRVRCPPAQDADWPRWPPPLF